ncbi:MAG: hypothetical protein Q8K37_02165 [Alphaproteobacteria bacterium]|nr:hypothetical protein [Alphaproteobacteria bacterium]
MKTFLFLSLILLCANTNNSYAHIGIFVKNNSKQALSVELPNQLPNSVTVNRNVTPTAHPYGVEVISIKDGVVNNLSELVRAPILLNVGKCNMAVKPAIEIFEIDNKGKEVRVPLTHRSANSQPKYRIVYSIGEQSSSCKVITHSRNDIAFEAN